VLFRTPKSPLKFVPVFKNIATTEILSLTLQSGIWLIARLTISAQGDKPALKAFEKITYKIKHMST
jgi:hypothetical protein